MLLALLVLTAAVLTVFAFRSFWRASVAWGMRLAAASHRCTSPDCAGEALAASAAERFGVQMVWSLTAGVALLVGALVAGAAALLVG